MEVHDLAQPLKMEPLRLDVPPAVSNGPVLAEDQR